MEENNLDKYFQEKLTGHTEEPPASVWEGIAANAPVTNTTQSRKYFWLFLLLLSLSGVAFLGYWLYEMNSRVATLERNIDSEKTNATQALEEKNTTTSKSHSAQRNAAFETVAKRKSLDLDISIHSDDSFQDMNQRASIDKRTTSKVKTAHSKQVQLNRRGTDSALANSGQSETQVGAALMAKIKKPHQWLPEQALPFNKNTKTHTPPINEEKRRENESISVAIEHGYSHLSSPTSQKRLNPTMALMSPITLFSHQTYPTLLDDGRDTEYDSKGKRSWFIFGYGMANYTHRRVIEAQDAVTEIANELNAIENGEIRPGGGLFIFRELNRSLRFGIGVEYNEWVQEADYSVEVPFENISEEFLVNSGTSEYSFEGNLGSSVGSTAYQSSSNTSYFNLEFDASSPEFAPLQIDISTRRTISYLTIPLSLEYVISAFPWRFSVGGGLSVNQILNSRLESRILPDSLGIETSEGEQIRGAYFAFQGGISVEYMFNERISFRLNPVYRSWMTPIFENEDFRTLPFGVAIRGGMVYRLGK